MAWNEIDRAEQDAHEARVELAEALERIAELEAENVKAAEELRKASDQAMGFRAGFEERGRLLLVALGALRIVDAELPDKPNAEFIRIAETELSK